MKNMKEEVRDNVRDKYLSVACNIKLANIAISKIEESIWMIVSEDVWHEIYNQLD